MVITKLEAHFPPVVDISELPSAELGIYQSSEMQMNWSHSHPPPTLVTLTLLL